MNRLTGCYHRLYQESFLGTIHINIEIFIIYPVRTAMYFILGFHLVGVGVGGSGGGAFAPFNEFAPS